MIARGNQSARLDKPLSNKRSLTCAVERHRVHNCCVRKTAERAQFMQGLRIQTDDTAGQLATRGASVFAR